MYKFAFISMLIGVTAACSAPSVALRQATGQQDADGSGVRSDENGTKKNKKKGKNGKGGEKETVASEVAFNETVFPLVKEHCGGDSCHAKGASPQFATDDLQASHDVLHTAGKVDLQNVESSRLYKRLVEDQHNCWSEDCDDDGEEMKEALEAWGDLAGASSSTEGDPGLQTKAKKIEGEFEESATSGDLIFEAEAGALSAPIVLGSDGGASGGSYVGAPNGTEPDRFRDVQNIDQAGQVTFTFEVDDAATYMIAGKVSAESAQDGSFFVKVDDGQPVVWNLTVNNGQWDWQIENQQGRQMDSGEHSVTIYRRHAGAKLDMLALTTDQAFQGGDANQFVPFLTMSYDLSEMLGGESAELLIDIQDFDEHGYKFMNPRINTSKSGLKVKNIGFLINGIVNKQLVTYNDIDKILDEGETQLSKATMIVPKDKGLGSDKLTVSFEALSFE